MDNTVLKIPCNCYEGYICEYCKLRTIVLERMKNKYGVFNESFEQNSEQFIEDAITMTIQEHYKNIQSVPKEKKILLGSLK